MRARRRFARVAVVAGAGLAACSFSLSLTPSSEEPDASTVISCDAPTLSCGDSVTLVASCTGKADVTETCAWGCLDDAPFPRCGKLVPSGGAVTPADLMPASDFNLSGTLDGQAGEINGMSAGSLNVAFRRGSNNIAIFRFKNLTITGPLKLQGNQAIALVASGDIIVNGIVDARGPCNDGAGRAAGPGGAGGGSEGNGSGSGGGSGDDTPNRGAGGGGHGALGGSGGGGISGGAAFGTPQIMLLVGGAGGGGAKTSQGGGGGGALQLVSNTSISIATGAGINAGGCGGIGGDGNADAGGGGGGAGGAILLEAPRITIAGTLAVNGGTGGNRNNGDGSAGRLDRTRATGPAGGGRGGAGEIFPGEAGTGAGNNQNNGGGGGAVGRIRLHTGTGAASEFVRTGAVLSPDTTDAMSTTTHVRANVQ